MARAIGLGDPLDSWTHKCGVLADSLSFEQACVDCTRLGTAPREFFQKTGRRLREIYPVDPWLNGWREFLELDIVRHQLRKAIGH